MGLRFDLFTLVIVNLPFLFFNSVPLRIKYNKAYQLVNNLLFYFVNTIALMLNFIDVIYFRFTQKRMTIDVFDFIDENSKEVFSLLPDFILDFWLPAVLWIIFALLLVWAGSHIKVNYLLINKYKRRNYIADTIKFILIFILFIIAGRGGLQNKPINIVNAGEYTEPRYFPIILNTPYTIIKTNGEYGLKEKSYFNNEQELNRIFTPVHRGSNKMGIFKDLNVVIIILESFTAEHSAYLNPKLDNGNYKGYTPFLDSLMKHSLVYRGFANGEKSMDGIPAIISGIPSLMSSPYLLSPYVSNDINSIAGLLKEKNYSTAFYHGGTNGTMGFEAYTKIAGFDKYYGRYEFDNDDYFDGKWGIFDEEFLQFTADRLNQSSKPFLSVIFTLSSHHPYTIPKKHKDKFPKGTLDIHESIGYTDYSLRRFFNTIKNEEWFDNTLFVLTADHTYAGYYPFYKTSVGRYSIPMVYYKHNEDWNEKSEIIAQQTDIVPSVLDYLNFKGDNVAFGQSVFDSTANRFAASYLYGIYQLIQGDYVLKFDGKKNVSLYNFANDSLLQHNLIKNEDSIIQEMSNLSEAIIQQYNNRMIHNNLTVKE